MLWGDNHYGVNRLVIQHSAKVPVSFSLRDDALHFIEAACIDVC
jgi:hypothetical protein